MLVAMLVAIARWVRYWFGLQPVILASSVVFAGYRTLTEHPDLWVRFAAIFAIEAALVAVSLMAWYTLRQGKPSARRWAIAASLLSLPVPGIGTIAGILGLVVFTRRDIVGQMATHATPEQPRLPGDGTSKLVDQLANGGQILVLLIANHYWTLWAHDQGLPESGGLVMWVLEFAIALHVSVLIHELGHVYGGWAFYMKLRHLVIGPFEWSVRGGKWEFSFNAAGLWGRGLAAMVPTTLRDLRTQRIFTTLGGPVGSLFAGGLGLLGGLSAKGHPWENWWGCFSMLATLGFSSFALNLIPMRPQDQYSDGAHLYQLLSRGPWADVHMAFSVAGATLVTPLRARNFDAGLLDRGTAFLKHGKEAMLLRLLKYMHHVDAGRIGEGVAAVAEAEALYPGLAQTLDAELHTDFIFVNALFRRDLEAARLWWGRMEAKTDVTRLKVDYWKARTALLWLEGQAQEAEAAWQKGNAIAQQLPAVGAYEFDRWCFRKLREALDETLALQVPPPLPDSAGQMVWSADPAQLAGGWVPLKHAGVAG